jgi:hypothetical protein
MTIKFTSNPNGVNDFLKKAMEMKERMKDYKWEMPGIKDSLDTGPIADINHLNHFLQVKYSESNYEIEEKNDRIWVFIYIHDDDKLYNILEELAARNKTVTTDVRMVRRLN